MPRVLVMRTESVASVLRYCWEFNNPDHISSYVRSSHPYDFMPAFLDLRLFVIKPLESAAVSRSAHPENFTFAIMLSGKSTITTISYDHEPLRCCTSRYRYYNSTSFF